MQKTVHQVAITASALLALSACVTDTKSFQDAEGKLFDRRGVDVILTHANAQALFFKDHGSVERYCRAPGPDFASTLSEGVSLSLGLPGGARSTGEDKSRGAVSFGGRNPEVLVARELLYRACELSLNLNADTALTLKIYERFLTSVENIARTQKGTGAAGLSGSTGDTRLAPPAILSPNPPVSTPAVTLPDTGLPPGP